MVCTTSMIRVYKIDIKIHNENTIIIFAVVACSFNGNVVLSKNFIKLSVNFIF